MSEQLNELLPFEDPNHPGNSSTYHTGKPCIEIGCDAPAGTGWSPYWCFEHNVERIQRIGGQIDALLERAQQRAEAQADE
jgi:hypothetical protein